MLSSSLADDYLAECRSHRCQPREEFSRHLRDGIVDVNLAGMPASDIRFFAAALCRHGRRVSPSSPPSTHASPSLRIAPTRSTISSRRDIITHKTSHSAPTFFTCVKVRVDGSSISRSRSSERRALLSSVAVPWNSRRQQPLRTSLSAISLPQHVEVLRSLVDGISRMITVHRAYLREFEWCGLALRLASSIQSSARQLCIALSRCTHLTRLRMDGSQLSKQQFMTISKGKWPFLVEASFSDCGLSDECCGGFVGLLRSAMDEVSVTEWRRSLRGGYDSPRELQGQQQQPTSQLLSRGLQRLDLSRNPIGDPSVTVLATALRGTTLMVLNLSSTATTAIGARRLCAPDTLEQSSLQSLDLSQTEVGHALTAPSSGVPEPSGGLLDSSSVAAGFRVVAHGLGQLIIVRETRGPTQPWYISGPPLVAPTESLAKPASNGKPQSDRSTVSPSVVAYSSLTPPPLPPTAQLPPPLPLGSTVLDARSSRGPALSLQGVPNSFTSPYPNEMTPAMHPVPLVLYAAFPGMAQTSYPGPLPHSYAAMPGPMVPSGNTAVGEKETAASLKLDAVSCPPMAPLAGQTSGVATPVEVAGPDTGELTAHPPAGDGVDDGASEQTSGAPHDYIAAATFHGDTELSNMAATEEDEEDEEEAVEKASKATADRRFLTALISRLEMYENDLSERLENHYQRTIEQMNTVEKDMRFRMQQLAESQRRQATTAAEQHSKSMEALALLQEAAKDHRSSLASSEEAMTEKMLSSIVDLIQLGMDRVKSEFEAGRQDDGTAASSPDGKNSMQGQSKSIFGQSSFLNQGSSVGPSEKKNDFLKEANQRLKSMGW